MQKDNHTEKVSVNINASTLSMIDLLVDNGYYSNRSDFINESVRDMLDKKSSIIDRIDAVERQKAEKSKEKADGQNSQNDWFIGVSGFEREYLEELKENGIKERIRGYGVLVIGKDCPDELVMETVESIKVRGKVHCSEALKKHYGIK